MKLARLLWAGFLYATGLIPWWYRRGFWLWEFNGFWMSMKPKEHPVGFANVKEFEKYRQRVAREFLSADPGPISRDPITAANAWLDSKVICHLFSFFSRRELHPLRALHWMRWLPWKGEVLELGAGAAPLADFLDKRWPFSSPVVSVADIPWVLHDYQMWRFPRGWPHHHVTTIDPIKPLKGKYDGILCVETLEHVPNPLATARELHSLLKKGGILVCDYGRQTKDQVLAPRGKTHRAATLFYLGTHFRVLRDKDAESGGLMVLQKK